METLLTSLVMMLMNVCKLDFEIGLLERHVMGESFGMLMDSSLTAWFSCLILIMAEHGTPERGLDPAFGIPPPM